MKNELQYRDSKIKTLEDLLTTNPDMEGAGTGLVPRPSDLKHDDQAMDQYRRTVSNVGFEEIARKLEEVRKKRREIEGEQQQGKLHTFFTRW